MPTRREQITKLLSEQTMSAYELSNYFKVDKSVITEDLKHIQKSIKPRRLKQKPSYCKRCGFIFKGKVKKPSKCPRCREEQIEEALFYIE